MTDSVQPDQAEQELADAMDDAVPSYGYSKVPVVGLGGSAGSIEALQNFFTTMPPKSGLAFVVVIHLAPDHDSILAELIQRTTRMPVVKVQDTLTVEAGKIYVIPPNHVLEAQGGQLVLSALPPDRARHVAVDIFFRTLADSHGAHAAAVVLSGLDGDGAVGMKRIKERGGLTVVQEPDEAMHASMPRAAIDTGMIDWVLPVQEMPARLLSYFRMEQVVMLPPQDGPGDQAAAKDESQLREVLGFLRTRTGRDFSSYKRATVLRRIGRRMQVNGVDNLGSYLTCMRTRQGETGALLQDLLISVTNFFRDADCFGALENYLPALFKDKGPNDAVRVWVVACATGEEAYSVAMILSDYARTLEAPPLLQVFATDLDEQAIQVAREGLYPSAIVADVSDERLRRFFVKEPRGYRVRRELREMVLFAVHDALRDSPFSRIDLVTCRNVLIYLTREAQARVMETMHFALVPGGKLFLGSSESVEDGSKLFDAVDKKHRIYRQRPKVRTGLALPPAPSSLHLALEPREPPRGGPVVSGHTFDGRAARTPTEAGRRGEPSPMHWGELHLRLLEQLAPPSVLVNADYDIVHLSASAGRFLQLAGGEPSNNLLRAVVPELRIELRAALYQAAQTVQEVQLPRLRLNVAGGTTATAVRVVPAPDGENVNLLVLFDSTTPDQDEDAETPARQLEPDPLARHLDREIERLKSHLRETVEQYEASSEELKASNEELQAMNEELRAATEELGTSREEMQSINEELTTVNHELKDKVEELSQANSDLQNLMNATAIATIFLDRELRITRYTPSATSLFNLIPSDVGRPLTDMATQLDYPELGGDAQQVLQRLAPVEREVGQSSGSWYLARLMPYRTVDDRIGGVVFTFIDITERKQAEEMRSWLAAVVSASTDAIASFAVDETLLSWNGGAEKLFGYTPQEAIGQRLSILAPPGREEHARMVSEVAGGRGLDNVEAVLRRRDGNAVHVTMTASPIRDAHGRVVAGTVIARDTTAARAAAEALRQSEERLRQLIENAVEYAIFSTDLKRRITVWNSGAERLLGWSEEEMIGATADVIFTPEDREKGGPEEESRTARRKGRAADERMHMRKDGSRFFGSGAMMLMRDPQGEPVGFVKIMRDLSERLPEPKA